MSLAAQNGRVPELCGPYRRILRTLERRKQKMLDTVGGYSPERLMYSPMPGDWSILQLFDHLMRTERSIRQTSTRNLTLPVLMPKPTLRERRRALYLLALFRLPTRVRVPKAASFVRRERPESLQAIAAQWSSERDLLRQFLIEQQRSALRETAMRHPAVGAMTLRSALSFLVVHLWHHEFQMSRLRRAISKAFL